MNGADGLMLLPKGEPGGKIVAKAGEMYPVMLLGGAIGTSGVKVRDSIHMNGLPTSEVKAKVSPVLISNVADDSARNLDLGRISGSIHSVLGSQHFCTHRGISASTKTAACSPKVAAGFGWKIGKAEIQTGRGQRRACGSSEGNG